MANPFDQFDGPAAQGNPFDAFDEPAQAGPGRTSQTLGLYQGLTKPLDVAARGLEYGLGKLGVPTEAINKALGMPSAAEAAQRHGEFIQQQEAAGVHPGTAGRIAGEVVGTLPAAAVSANPFVIGGISGALLSDAKTPGELVTDVGLGAAGGKLGDLAVKGLQRVVSPVTRAGAKLLLGEGVSLTPGQIAGGITKRIEDAATTIPGTGDVIKSAQRRSLETFNRAAANRALTPIGQKLPDNVAIGHDAIAHVQDTLDNAYQAVLPSLTVKEDARMVSELASLRSLAANLDPNGAAQVGKNIDKIEQAFSPGARAMSGQTMKDIDSELGRLVRTYRSSAVGGERLVGNALAEAQDILRDTVQRSNPAKAAVLKGINRGYANLVRLETAARSAKDGIFTPAQLQTATRVADSSLRKRASARGAALMQDLATAGRDVLPSSVPDSGTITRGLVAAGLGHFGGGALGLTALEPTALATMGAGAAAYSKPGNALLQYLMTQRPAGANNLANLLSYLKTPAAMGGAIATSD